MTITPRPATAQIFSTPDCQQCKMTYLAMERAGIDFTVTDVSQDPDAATLVKTLGYLQAPVVVLSDGTHWSGFRPDLIKSPH